LRGQCRVQAQLSAVAKNEDIDVLVRLQIGQVSRYVAMYTHSATIERQNAIAATDASPVRGRSFGHATNRQVAGFRIEPDAERRTIAAK
jgi:hypothetical protein